MSEVCLAREEFEEETVSVQAKRKQRLGERDLGDPIVLPSGSPYSQAPIPEPGVPTGCQCAHGACNLHSLASGQVHDVATIVCLIV